MEIKAPEKDFDINQIEDELDALNQTVMEDIGESRLELTVETNKKKKRSASREKVKTLSK